MANGIVINFIGEINDKTTGILFFVLTNQLQSGVKEIRLNISSPGGLVFHAITVHNFILGLQDVTVHAHNLGQIDSAANVIFLAGKVRTASKAATFLMHPPKAMFNGPQAMSIEEMGERLEGLKSDETKMAGIIGACISKSPKEIIQMFKKRRTYSSEQGIELGFISRLEEYSVTPGQPTFTITNNA